MANPKTLRLILGDQLNPHHSWFKKPEKHITFVLMEVLQETGYVKHHVQKVCAFFAAMRNFAERLRQQGHRVIYLFLDDPENRQTFEDNIKHLIKQQKFQRLEYMLPDEYRLDTQIKELVSHLTVPSAAVDSEHFLTQREELKNFFAGKKQLLMESFYRSMRKKFHILMENGIPAGKQWNFDKENRKRFDSSVPIPTPLFFKNDVTHIVNSLDKMGVITFGTIKQKCLIWPVSLQQSSRLVKHFIAHGLPYFGTYQDAMTQDNWTLFHSRLSFALNTKMLHPMKVIERSIQTWMNDKQQIGINQIEGFVRQILGWREYMRGVYWACMPEFSRMNFFNHKKSLPHYFWDGQTRMNCMRAALQQSLEHAWAHHIQRLMVTGNFSLLAGIHPDEVDAWYLGVYIDAVQWVEITNTRGMSQFADGGITATKPYVSSARYINTMSDYCAGCHYSYQKRHGDCACPFNSLYWDFFVRHRTKLEKNPRVGMVYRTWDRMDKKDCTRLIDQAAVYKKNLEKL
jgi:deoxyribodipyrimidine photolyase-related protein